MNNINNQSEMMRRLENDFTYHPPKGDQIERYQQIRDKAKEFAMLVVTLAPASRECSLALTHIDSASMFANAAIARNEVED